MKNTLSRLSYKSVFLYKFARLIETMAELYDIFISYSSKDSKVVHTYASYLERQGYRVWYDVKGLYTGVEFSQEIVNSIENSKLVIFFSSAHSNESKWTKGEILSALKFTKPILPVRIDDSEYDKSLMLVLLPLQYLDFKLKSQNESFKDLFDAVQKFIGSPSLPSPVDDQSKTGSSRHGQKLCMCVSVVASLLFSFCMMYLCGEYWMNLSLSLFTLFITSSVCILTSYLIIRFEKNWNERAKIVNIFLLLGIIFFLSYSMMAFGLCFISLDVFLLNFPSIICAIIALLAFHQLMLFKKRGYVMLWVSALLFSVGSYWWLGPSLVIPLVLASVACVCMAVFTLVIKVKHQVVSLWERLT